MKYLSHSEDETQKIGYEVAEKIKKGDVISLTGSLGAGKTVFAKGFAKQLGIEEAIVSPTFTLVQEGRIGGHASILIGGSGSGFDWKSFFSIFYEHSMTPSLFWRLGYGNLQGRHMIYLGIGGAF